MQSDSLKGYSSSLSRCSVLRSYLDYVEDHIRNVHKAWEIFKSVDSSCQKAGGESLLADDYTFWTIDSYVHQHDMSKLSAEEFVQYAMWFYGPSGTDYDLLEDGGLLEKSHKECQVSFSAAWKHHRDNNHHHWEKWTTTEYPYYNEKYCHFICMVLDWMAMGMKFGDTAEQYYRKNEEKIILPEWAKQHLPVIFERLRSNTK